MKDIATGHVLITAQNHGFAVAGTETAIPGAPDLEVTHVNLNDGTVEGLRHREQTDLRGAVPSGGRARPARRPPAVQRSSWKRSVPMPREVTQTLDT